MSLSRILFYGCENRIITIWASILLVGCINSSSAIVLNSAYTNDNTGVISGYLQISSSITFSLLILQKLQLSSHPSEVLVSSKLPDPPQLLQSPLLFQVPIAYCIDYCCFILSIMYSYLSYATIFCQYSSHDSHIFNTYVMFLYPLNMLNYRTLWRVYSSRTFFE